MLFLSLVGFVSRVGHVVGDLQIRAGRTLAMR